VAYTFATAQTEFFARGFDYLNQDAAGRTRAKRWLVEGYLEDICADEPWDFLRTSTSGAAPLTISDLDTIISVKDTTNDEPLYGADHGWLEDSYPDLTTTGTPEWYYLSDDTTLSVYPANTSDTIQVRYFKVPAEPSDDADEFVVPSRWQGLIIDAAVIRAYMDSDNFEAAGLLQSRFDRRLEKMKWAHMVRDSHPRFVQMTQGGW
jgi:hypothetical protein